MSGIHVLACGDRWVLTVTASAPEKAAAALWSGRTGQQGVSALGGNILVCGQTSVLDPGGHHRAESQKRYHIRRVGLDLASR